MGSKASVFCDQEIADYAELTFLTKREVLKACSIWIEQVGDINSENRLRRFPISAVLKMPQLKVNPFGTRIVKVFSSLDDDHMNFEDFLDMVSIMSDKAPFHLKAHYAFRIYDMDNDGTLDKEDLNLILDYLTLSKLPTEAKDKLVQKILEETDLDGDGISSEEFEHFLTKCHDFCSLFKFNL